MPMVREREMPNRPERVRELVLVASLEHPDLLQRLDLARFAIRE